MAKDRIKLSDAKALIAEGQSPEAIAEKFDIEDDSAPAAAASRPTVSDIPDKAASIRAVARARLAAVGTTPEEVKRRVAAGGSPDPDAPTTGERFGADVAALGAGTGELLGAATVGVGEQIVNLASAPFRSSAAAAGALLGGGSLSDAVKEARNVQPHREAETLVAEASNDAQKTFRRALGVRPKVIVPQEEIMRQVPGAAVALEGAAALTPRIRAVLRSKGVSVAEDAVAPLQSTDNTSAAAAQPPLESTPAPEAAEVAPPPEVAATPAPDAVAAERPPLWEMSPDELEREHALAKAGDAELLDAAFGSEGAKRYQRLQRRANSTTLPRADTDAAYSEIERMESSLPPSMQRRLFGVGEPGPSVDEIGAYKDGLSRLDGSSPESLGESLKWALTKLGPENTDIAQWSEEGRVAAAQMRHAFEIAVDEGWDPQEVLNAALRSASRRFPGEAGYMLRRFAKRSAAEVRSPTATRQLAAPADLSDADAAALNAEREAATRGGYRKHVSPVDEADIEPGKRYPVEKYFDKTASPEAAAKGREVYDAFAKWRAMAKEKLGDTIRLVRYGGERPERTVTHWSEPGDAGAHATDGVRARDLIERDVPIDDVVAAPYFGEGKRQEFLVLNRKSPNATLPEENGTLHEDSAMPLPKVGDVTAAAKKFAPAKEFADAIAPATASPEAANAADILRRSKSEIANDAAIERAKNVETAKMFGRANDEQNIANISEYEKTGQFRDAPAGYSEMYKETTDAAHATLQDVYGGDRVGYVDNYVRRAFKFGSEKDAAKASGVLSNWIGSLSASKSPLKGRVLSVPLDEALATMRASGIDVKPATTNPEILRQWTVENANQARVYKQAWEEAKASKLIQFVRQGDRIPQGLIELNDRVAKVFRPTDDGMVQTGRYFAEPGAARIFNNAISKGLGGSPTFRGIRAINNAYNQVQLGFSGFHLTGTAINAGISDLSLGLQQLLQGDIGSGAKSVGRSAVPGLSFVRDMFNGREFVNDLIANDPVARQILTEKLNPAGGRLAIDQSYRNAAYENMVNAWSNKRYIRALGKAPLAVVQKVASPLMEYAIPRVKIGAFLDLAEAMREKLGPGASDVEIQRGYEQAWDSIDNRFGQLVHDNLFWNRTAADLAQISTRSVGWNLGTIRELGGGSVDLLHGKLTPRALYTFALPLAVGTIGAVYHFLHTGEAPKETRDFFYPQNGLTDKRGNPDRVSLPTYMKDVFAYGRDPIGTLEHKASPLLSLAFDLGTNRDYFGDMIRNPEDPAMKRWLQSGSYALKQFRPLSFQQMADTASESGGGTRSVEQLFGFTKAPATMRMTSEEAATAAERRRRQNERTMERNRRRHP